MSTKTHTFRVKTCDREALLHFCRKRGVTQSDALRLLILRGPVAFSVCESIPEPYIPFLNDTFSVGDGQIVDLERIRQRTNLSQCVNVFEGFARDNAIDEVDAESSDRFVELPDLIRDRLFAVVYAMEDVSSFVHGLASCSDESSSGAECAKARLAPAYLHLLSLKSQTFRLTPSGYVRFAIPLLDAIWNRGRDGGEDAGRHVAPQTYIPVVDLEEFCEDLRACGKVLNDSVRYLNSEFKGFYSSDESFNERRMEVLLGKLGVAVGCYESLRSKYSIPSSSGGA